MKPQRIQRKRTKGWQKPPGAIYVGRPSRWGNPFRVGERGLEHAVDAVDAFEFWIESTTYGQALAERAREELRGKDLMCFCREGAPCHADVLLRIANVESPAAS